MRINRVVVGVVAMPVVIATGLAAAYVQIRLFGILHWELALFLAGVSGCGVFLLADKLGVLAEPHAQRRGFLTDDESEERPPEVDSRPIVPR